MYNGKTKLILKYLGFLVTEYDFSFKFQTFENYRGFCGPVDTYSFYNNYGCFTLHNIVQKGEWGWFLSDKFSDNQYALLSSEIPQDQYISCCWTLRGQLKQLTNSIKIQLLSTGMMFGIKTTAKAGGKSGNGLREP